MSTETSIPTVDAGHVDISFTDVWQDASGNDVNGPDAVCIDAYGPIFIDVKHAPAVALAILTAAGVRAADPMNSDEDLFAGDEDGAEWAVMWLEKLAKVQSAEQELTRRRDALAAEIDLDANHYEATCVVARKAIDMIIALQDEATKV